MPILSRRRKNVNKVRVVFRPYMEVGRVKGIKPTNKNDPDVPARTRYDERNKAIYNEYLQGKTHQDLHKDYDLTVKRIQDIVHERQAETLITPDKLKWLVESSRKRIQSAHVQLSKMEEKHTQITKKTKKGLLGKETETTRKNLLLYSEMTTLRNYILKESQYLAHLLDCLSEQNNTTINNNIVNVSPEDAKRRLGNNLQLLKRHGLDFSRNESTRF